MKLSAIILVKDGFVVNKYRFSEYRPIGRLIHTLRRLEELQIDEVIILNKSHGTDPVEDFKKLWISKQESIPFSTPLAYGGGVNKQEHVEGLISQGVERIVLPGNKVGSKLQANVAKIFGEQALIFHLPYKYQMNELTFHLGQGRVSNQEFLERLSFEFAGEYVITSMNSEGTNKIKTREVRNVLSKFHENVRVIYSGGIATLDHVEFLSTLSINGVALGNILATREAFVLNVKRNCNGVTRGIEEVLVR